MEFMDGICKTRECAWDVLLSESMKDQEATVEGAIHSIRNMGDVAFVILRKKEGLFQTVYENDKTNVSIHDLKEAMCVRLTGILHDASHIYGGYNDLNDFLCSKRSGQAERWQEKPEPEKRQRQARQPERKGKGIGM